MTRQMGFLETPGLPGVVEPPSVLGRINASVRARIEKVRLLGLDVDGVMTDGRLYYHDDGTETKAFDVRDGHGIKMLQRAGIDVFVISGRHCPMVDKRCEDLGIAEVVQGAVDKVAPLEALLSRKAVEPEQSAFIGDDVVDLPVMRRVGFAVAVADASETLFNDAHYTTVCPGGRGAIREVAELILAVQGKWQEIAGRYFQ